MKNKKLARRLKLNKQTVSNMDSTRKKVVKGGHGDSCYTVCDDYTYVVDCSGSPGTGYCPTDTCGTGQSECESIGQEWCGTMPEDTCC